MYKLTDGFINLLKWPVAVCLLLSAPALINSYMYFDFFRFKFYMLGAGILFFIFTLFTAGYATKQNIQIISHELTHTFFAFLTLHKVGRIRLHPDGSGGSMQLKGHGNWLISLSPYFFPLFAFFYMLIMPFLLEATNSHWTIYAILGYFLAYHWLVVLTQANLQQTDLSQEGFIFSYIVIISANLFTTGCVLAFTSKSWQGIFTFIQLINKLNLEMFQKCYHLIMTNFQSFFVG